MINGHRAAALPRRRYNGTVPATYGRRVIPELSVLRHFEQRLMMP
jgi:hypothetical protein